MGQPSTTVDVRDMLCAQALAVVDEAVKRLGPGGCLTVRFNTPDVRQDLIVWARDRGLGLREAGAETLQLERLPAPPGGGAQAGLR